MILEDAELGNLEKRTQPLQLLREGEKKSADSLTLQCPCVSKIFFLGGQTLF